MPQVAEERQWIGKCCWRGDARQFQCSPWGRTSVGLDQGEPV